MRSALIGWAGACKCGMPLVRRSCRCHSCCERRTGTNQGCRPVRATPTSPHGLSAKREWMVELPDCSPSRRAPVCRIYSAPHPFEMRSSNRRSFNSWPRRRSADAVQPWTPTRSLALGSACPRCHALDRHEHGYRGPQVRRGPDGVLLDRGLDPASVDDRADPIPLLSHLRELDCDGAIGKATRHEKNYRNG